MRDLTNGVAQVLGVGYFWLVPLLGCALVMWLCVRARSMHPIVSRVWRLVMGRTPVGHAGVSAAIAELEVLLRLRFLFGIPFRTLAQGERVRRWAKRNDEDLSSVRSCGRWFDLDSCSLLADKLPPRWQQTLKWLVAYVCGTLALYAALIVLPDRALLQFKESRLWFTMTPTSASAVLGDGRFAKEDCGLPDEKIGRTAFNKEERASLCEAFSSPSTQEYVRLNIKVQRFTAGVVAGALLWFTFVLSRSYRQVISAQGMRERLAGRK